MKNIKIKLDNELNSIYVYDDLKKIGSIKYKFNKFHTNNVYLQLHLNSFSFDGGQLFNILATHFNKNLQINEYSNEKELINFIKANGFVLKRKCYECSYTEKELKDRTESKQYLNLVHKNDSIYQEALQLLYEKYKRDHESINPLTCSFKEFSLNIPSHATVQLIDNCVVNYAFIDKNEIAYIGSNKIETLRLFSNQVIKTIFKKYPIVEFEADDCDLEAMTLKDMFYNESNKSFNAYIYTKD